MSSHMDGLADAWQATAVRLVDLTLPQKIALAVAADMSMFALALAGSATLSGADVVFGPMQPAGFVIGVGVSILTLLLFGGYRDMVRFIGADFMIRLATSVALGAVVLHVIAPFGGIPPSGHNTILFAILAFSGVGMMRLAARHLLRPARSTADRIKVLIYGAGDAGNQLDAALAFSGRYDVVGFVDDRRNLAGRVMRGRPIYQPSEMPRLHAQAVFNKVLLAMPSITRQRQQEILHILARLAVKVFVMPRMEDLASGRKRVDELQEIRIEDLLGREPVPPIEGLLDLFLRDQIVLVTGAGGSIGSELSRLIVERGARKLVLFEASEFALYSIHRELQDRPALNIELVPVLGNVLDRRHFESVIRQHGVTTIYHAAAYKHVPLVEHNVVAAVHNNVKGTLTVARVAMACGVANFVLVSTDKAVRPTNIMGASKRVCELIVQSFAEQYPKARLSTVRFGNVLGSSGSVVPLFQEQIRNGGPVTVTHPEVTRYFMTITEAAQLVIQAGAMGRHGEVFVLDMGKAIRIHDLAEHMIRLTGLQPRTPQQPEGDIEIRYTGLRPGEKLYEELLIGNEPHGTGHPRIFQANEAAIGWNELRLSLETIEAAIRLNNEAVLLQVLRSLVPEFGGAQGTGKAVQDFARTLPRPGIIVPAPVAVNEEVAGSLVQQ